MDITIKSCNNIDNGVITIQEDKLNIKYAINGTGKSTIANAIICSSNDLINSTQTLAELKPFKYLGSDDKEPDVSGCDNIKSTMIFNEKYINDYIFQPDELVKGSFNIFIEDDTYLNGLEEINELVEDIKKIFLENKDIDDLINDFNDLSGSFGRSTASGIHGSSNLAKAFKNGNKVENIPEELIDYKEYIQHNENYKWIKWQLDGKSFLNLTDNCPYCVSNIKSKKEKIVKISNIYDPKSVENLNKIVEVFHRLNQYFSDSTKEIIDEFIKNLDGYSVEHVQFLREVKEQIDRLNSKFNAAKNISFQSLKDVDKVIDELKQYKIDLKLYNHLYSKNTEIKANIINSSIDNILEKAGILQGKINQQKKYVERLIEKNKKNINDFLKNAGYNYSVDLPENESGQHQLKLIHNDISSEIKDVANHLSFGERNAFALVLFMYDAIKTKPDTIILDDPISSFDKNKKYAIIDMLFRRNESLKDKTVLLLTHDFEPIVDMVHHHRDRFTIPYTTFLENINGNLIEKEVERGDIQTFIEINNRNIYEVPESIQKIVYMRRLFEITNNTNMEYHIISSLLHKREAPEVKNGTGLREMTYTEIKQGLAVIRKYIPNFKYRQLVDKIKDDEKMKEIYASLDNNYEKLHVYRMIFDDRDHAADSDIINKFINEAFHIENDYIYQLNPRKYQTVPQYVINECDCLVATIEKSKSC